MSAKTATPTIGIFGHFQPGLFETILKNLENANREYDLIFLLSDNLFNSKNKSDRKYCESLSYLKILPESEIIKKTSYIFSLGGDGTLLRTARMIGKRDIGIVGVNFGKLGFLTEFNPEEVENVIEQIVKDKCSFDKRMVLSASVYDEDGAHIDDHNLWAMNDVVVDKSGYSKLISLDIMVGKDRVGYYRADGIILSTPAGSTGYSLACGGPILFPAMDAIIITPVCPHTLTIRPLIIPTDKEITIIAHTEYHEILVASDGESKTYKTKSIKVKIKKAHETVSIVRNSKRTYFDVLRQKLNWSNDTRGTQV